MTSSSQSQPKSSSALVSSFVEAGNPAELSKWLRAYGCSRCELGKKFKPVVYRGNPNSKRMIVGEAPGLYEQEQGNPFVGPAGQLLNRIFASVGWSTDTDWYLTNVVKCRPVAEPGSGKQNLTPTAAHRKACLPYIDLEVEQIQPNIMVLLGKSATCSIFPACQNRPLGSLVGTMQYYKSNFGEVAFFIMYHPAYLLHAQKQPERYQAARQATWEHIQKLKELVDEIEGC